MNENNFSPRLLYPGKLPLKIDEAIKIFHDKQKLKQYMTTKLPLEKILQGILHREDKSKQNCDRTGVSNTGEEKISKQRVALPWLHTIKPLNNKNN
jgi:hypothetical protein